MLSLGASRRLMGHLESIALVLAVFLLPIDRFPYLHHVPLKLGFISAALLVVVAAYRLLDFKKDQWRRLLFTALLFGLPIAAYLFSWHYAIDKTLAVGATKLLASAILKAICFYIILVAAPERWSFLKKTIYAVTALVVAFAFFQFFFDVFGASAKVTDLRACCTSNSTYIFPRVHSVSIEPLYFANFLLLPIWLMTFDLMSSVGLRRNKRFIGLFIGTLVIFILTNSRGAFASLIVSLAVFLIFYRHRIFSRLRKVMAPFLAIVIGGSALLVMLAGGASIFIHKHSLYGAHSGIGGSLDLFGSHSVNIFDDSAHTRYNTWPKGFKLISEHPLKGVGAYNSRVALHESAYRSGAQDISLQPFNNDFLGTLVDLGVVGVITFAPIGIAALVLCWRVLRLKSSLAAPICLTIIAMLVQANFFHSILLTRSWVVLALLFALYPYERRSNGKA